MLVGYFLSKVKRKIRIFYDKNKFSECLKMYNIQKFEKICQGHNIFIKIYLPIWYVISIFRMPFLSKEILENAVISIDNR